MLFNWKYHTIINGLYNMYNCFENRAFSAKSNSLTYFHRNYSLHTQRHINL